MEKPANPFKQLEPDVTCPPHLKVELFSEIDLIRNITTVIDVYVGDFFGLAATLTTALQPNPDESTHPTL